MNLTNPLISMWIHVDRGMASAKFWLENIALARNAGVSAKELGEVQRLVQERQAQLLEAWHVFFGTATDLRVKQVFTGEDRLTVELMDGRAISVPLAWYPRLAKATPAQLSRWEVAGGGYASTGRRSTRI